MRSRWFSTRRLWVVVVAVFGVWLLAASVLAPLLIRALHAGQLGPLGALLPGRHKVPVEDYLAAWITLARSLTFVLATAGLILVVVQNLFLRHADTPAGTGRAPSTREILISGLWFGLVTGLGEDWYVLGKLFYVHQTVPDLRQAGPHTLWMTPLGEAIWFVCAAVLLIPVARLVERRAGGDAAGRAVTGVLSFMTVLALLMVSERLALWSAMILATGLALVVARSRGMTFEIRGPVAGRQVLAFAVLTAVLGAGVKVVELRREQASLAIHSAPATAVPNVLLLVLDTQRAGNMSLYGYGRPTTPRLSKLAETGVTFLRAIAPAPWTLPSHAAMLTGLTNHVLGTDWERGLDHRFLTLAEVLADLGYRTGGFAANTVFCNRFYGIDQGFGRYRDEALTPMGVLLRTWYGRNLGVWAMERAGNYQTIWRRRSATINEEFLTWLDDSPADRPFFAFLNYFDVHEPYLAPSPFREEFAPEGGRYWLRKGPESSRYTAREIRQLKDHYDGGTAYADAQLGALMDSLQARGQLDSTVVIVVADHGEEFGEHGRMGHANHVYLPETWVPLVIRYPEAVPAGLRVGTPVSVRSIPATVMALAEPAVETPFPGPSLTQHWNSTTVMQDTVVSEFGGDQAVLLGNFQLIKHANGDTELYDLLNDPGEHTDVADQRPRMVKKLLAMLTTVQAEAAEAAAETETPAPDGLDLYP